jgi:hypothetical protein
MINLGRNNIIMEDLSYKTIKNAVINLYSEVHFEYKKKFYWIAYYKNGIHLSDDEGNTQYFNDVKSLFDRGIIEGKHLEEIWNDVKVDSVS